MKIIYSTVLCLLVVMMDLANARECEVEERDKAASFAEAAGKKIMNKFPLGGRDLRIGLSSCDYNTFTKRFKMGIDIEWNGATNRDNYYNISGELRTDEDSSNTEFSQTYANDNVKNMAFWRNVIVGVGAVIILGTLKDEARKQEVIEEQQRQAERERQAEQQRLAAKLAVEAEQRRQEEQRRQQVAEQQRRQQAVAEQRRQEEQQRQEEEQQRQEEEQRRLLINEFQAVKRATAFVD